MKLTRKGCSLAALMSILCLTGCSNEAPWGSGSDEVGRISLKVAANGAVNKSTRADDEVSPVIPTSDDFSVALSSRDGSYSKTWTTPSAFNGEEGFPMGSYSLSVVSGDIEEEGFSNPCFAGSTDVAVALGEETAATVTATLANSMVSVRYSDEFRALFPNYQALLTSDGHVSPVVMNMNETRPAYMSPRQIRLSLSLTNQQGKQQTIVPAVFNALPQHHYVIIVGVKEEIGVNTLDVSFDENVVHETTEIFLTDELFTSPAPVVSANADAASPINAIEQVALNGQNPELHVVAMGGIAKALLSFETEGGTLPLTNATMDLVKLTAAEQEVLKNAGIISSGFSVASGRDILNQMAVVNFSDFTKSLVPGVYKAKLLVQDKFGRVTDETTSPVIEIKVDELMYELQQTQAPKYLSDRVEVGVQSNSSSLVDGMTFKVDGQEAKVISSVKTESSSQDKAFAYNVSLQLPSKNLVSDSQCVVEGVVGRKTPAKIELATEMPAYTVDTDPKAKSILMRVNYEDADMRKAIVSNCKVYNGPAEVTSSMIKRYPETGLIAITGFNPGSKYENISLTLGSSKERNNLPIAAFSTEAAAGVPNGDFEDLDETIKTTVQQGGKWARTVAGQLFTTNLSMLVKEPSGWLTTNPITCNLNASNKNSWYMVPSVYNTTIQENGWASIQPKVDVIQKQHTTTAQVYKNYSSKSKANAMVIRNVAWDDNGANIKDDKGTYGTSNYYSHNVPTIANRTAGRMWLGISGQEGAAFASRPAKLKGFYQFVADAHDPNEKGVVEIQILSGDKVIGTASKELPACNGYTAFELPLNYVGMVEGFNLKATSLRISFSSSNRSGDIKTTDYCSKDECVSRGAMLIVDDLSFEY